MTRVGQRRGECHGNIRTCYLFIFFSLLFIVVSGMYFEKNYASHVNS
jgi:hypothetical protein